MLASEFLYNDETDAFSWTMTVAPDNGLLPDATWMVITSSGSEPKSSTASVAILDLNLRPDLARPNDGRFGVSVLQPPQAPEPATLPLIVAGLLLIALARRLHHGRLPAPPG